MEEKDMMNFVQLITLQIKCFYGMEHIYLII